MNGFPRVVENSSGHRATPWNPRRVIHQVKLDRREPVDVVGQVRTRRADPGRRSRRSSLGSVRKKPPSIRLARTGAVAPRSAHSHHDRHTVFRSRRPALHPGAGPGRTEPQHALVPRRNYLEQPRHVITDGHPLRQVAVLRGRPCIESLVTQACRDGERGRTWTPRESHAMTAGNRFAVRSSRREHRNRRHLRKPHARVYWGGRLADR